MATEQLIVELLLDTSNVESALEELTKSGQIDKGTADAFKATTDALRKQTVEARKANDAAKPLKKTFDDVGKSMKGLSTSFMQGVSEGIADALSEAGVSMDEFTAAMQDALGGNKKLQTQLDKTTKELEELRAANKTAGKEYADLTKAVGLLQKQLDEANEKIKKFGDRGEESGNKQKTLKQELREIVQQLAALKLAGQDNTETYIKLNERAGELKDTIADVNVEISNAGSDTKGLDDLLGTAQAVAGGFAVAQGVVGLFGDESEELQKTLLRVNSAMAVLQGLQQVSNALQKEGSVTLLIANTQIKTT